ncbi:WhiB family transcriptional regulator [Streptomyces alfalfae]|uniref:WhiB family transcriptional regulator n=1 Tax=Streptomyces alfalfae TaxID=1642299 RepID=UPI002811FA9E|nr:WhiB family transcriptional regulator [Streptomyces alfalfae]
MRYSMTSEQARLSRRAALQAAVDTAAVCARLDPDVFFREEREHQISWQTRREDAVRVCAGCPARVACAELALRDGDGRADTDDMVRGGLTGAELAAARADRADRLAAAVDADRDTEGQHLDDLVARLRRAALVTTDRRWQAAQNEEVRTLAGEIRRIRTTRRARAGWETAA